MKNLVLFDLDGTLIDTSYDLNDCMNKMLLNNGFKAISVEETKKFLGYGLRRYVELATKETDADKLDAYTKEYKKYFDEDTHAKTVPYQGMKELILKLKSKGIKVAVVTNKPQLTAEQVCREKFEGVEFDYIMGQRDGIKPKPYRQSVDIVIQELGISPSLCVYVGDSEVDYQTAVNVGIDSINVLWGFRTKKQLKECGVRNFAKTPEELFNKIMFEVYENMSKKKTKTFMKEFKAFITRGNVLDLAVATIIGSAFGSIVSSFTNGIIMPLISLLFKAENLDKLVVVLRPEKVNELGEVVQAAVTWQYGTLIQAVINFLIIALFLFIVIKVITGIRKGLDFDAKIRASVQAKLDSDTPLDMAEEKWLKRQLKKDPDGAPRKTPPAPAPAPVEPSSTDKLLMQILEQLKENKK